MGQVGVLEEIALKCEAQGVLQDHHTFNMSFGNL